MAWTRTEPRSWQIWDSLMLRKWGVVSAELKSQDLPFTSASGLERTLYPDAQGCAGTRCSLYNTRGPLSLFCSMEKHAYLCKGVLSCWNTAWSHWEGHLVLFREAKPSPKAVLNRDCHFYTICAAMYWLGAFKSGTAQLHLSLEPSKSCSDL